VHVFPNGTVTSLANLSKQFAYAVVEVRAAYAENLDRVFGTIREVGASMQADARWAPVLVAPIEVVGVVSIADGYATIAASSRRGRCTRAGRERTAEASPWRHGRAGFTRTRHSARCFI